MDVKDKIIDEAEQKKIYKSENYDLSYIERLIKKERERGMHTLSYREQIILLNYLEQQEKLNKIIEDIKK